MTRAWLVTLALGCTREAPAPVPVPVPVTTLAPNPPSPEGPPDLAAIAAQVAALHPTPLPFTGGDAGPPLRGRVLDYRGRPVIGAQIRLCCQDDGAAWPDQRSAADATWSLNASPSNLIIEILASGYARQAATGPPWSNTGDATLYRGPRRIAALALEAHNPTDRLWLALELAAMGAEGEDGPMDRVSGSKGDLGLDTWRTAALLLPELRQIATSEAFHAASPASVENALGLLRTRAAPEDDPLVAARRAPPTDPVRGDTLEALCVAWTSVMVGEAAPKEEGPPPNFCEVRASDEAAGVAIIGLTASWEDFGCRWDGVARRTDGVWTLLDYWEGMRWG